MRCVCTVSTQLIATVARSSALLQTDDNLLEAALLPCTFRDRDELTKESDWTNPRYHGFYSIIRRQNGLASRVVSLIAGTLQVLVLSFFQGGLRPESSAPFHRRVATVERTLRHPDSATCDLTSFSTCKGCNWIYVVIRYAAG